MARKRDASTHAKQLAFLAVFRRVVNVTAAAAAAGIKPEDHYGWIRRDTVYRASWETVQDEAAQALEDEAVRRAFEGVKRPVLYKGKQVRTGRGRHSKILYHTEYSDQLLLAVLKRYRPALYRERTVTEVTGAVEIIDRLQAARARLIKMQGNEQPTGTAG